MKRYQIKAFTLVELIIVITILAILATIGFMSYQSYTSDARDANRVTTVKQISDGLDITYVKKASYPMPDGTLSTGSINGITYAYRGTIGSNISQIIKMDKSVNPLSKEEYMYGVSSDKTQYQIALVLENNISQINSITNTTYAAGKETAKVNGNYPGYMKFASGSETWIANIPSLLWNNSGSVNLMNTGTYFVVDKKSNLPYKASNNDLGTKNADTIIQEITGTGISKLAGVNITNMKTGQDVANNFNSVLLASFGGNINSISNKILNTNSSDIVLVNGACTGAIANSVYYSGVTNYSLINASAGTSLVAYYNINPSENTCQFKCITNTIWDGVDCTYQYTTTSGNANYYVSLPADGSRYWRTLGTAKSSGYIKFEIARRDTFSYGGIYIDGKQAFFPIKYGVASYDSVYFARDIRFSNHWVETGVNTSNNGASGYATIWINKGELIQIMGHRSNMTVTGNLQGTTTGYQ